MAGPGLPTNLSGSPHPAAHNSIAVIVNEFETTIGTANDGDVLTFNSATGTYGPEASAGGSPALGNLPAEVGAIVLTTVGSRPAVPVGAIVIAVGGTTPPAWGLTNDVHIASA